MASRFNATEKRFKDTRNTGGITVRGVQLETDKDGFIEGPPDLAKDIEPHGFIAEDSPAYAEWLKSNPPPVAPTKK